MNVIKDIAVNSIPFHKILFAATSDPDYEMDRIVLLEDYPNYGEYTLVAGGHCSCYGFDETEWTATQYSKEELMKVVSNWIENGYGAETKIAPLIVDYLSE